MLLQDYNNCTPFFKVVTDVHQFWMLLHDYNNCAPFFEVVTPVAIDAHQSSKLVYHSNLNPEDRSSRQLHVLAHAGDQYQDHF
jgi:hypothetical protein